MIAGMPWYVFVMGVLGGVSGGACVLAHVIGTDSAPASPDDYWEARFYPWTDDRGPM